MGHKIEVKSSSTNGCRLQNTMDLLESSQCARQTGEERPAQWRPPVTFVQLSWPLDKVGIVSATKFFINSGFGTNFLSLGLRDPRTEIDNNKI